MPTSQIPTSQLLTAYTIIHTHKLPTHWSADHIHTQHPCNEFLCHRFLWQSDGTHNSHPPKKLFLTVWDKIHRITKENNYIKVQFLKYFRCFVNLCRMSQRPEFLRAASPSDISDMVVVCLFLVFLTCFLVLVGKDTLILGQDFSIHLWKGTRVPTPTPPQSVMDSYFYKSNAND